MLCTTIYTIHFSNNPLNRLSNDLYASDRSSPMLNRCVTSALSWSGAESRRQAPTARSKHVCGRFDRVRPHKLWHDCIDTTFQHLSWTLECFMNVRATQNGRVRPMGAHEGSAVGACGPPLSLYLRPSRPPAGTAERASRLPVGACRKTESPARCDGDGPRYQRANPGGPVSSHGPTRSILSHSGRLQSVVGSPLVVLESHSGRCGSWQG